MKLLRKSAILIGALVLGAGIGSAFADGLPHVVSDSDEGRPKPTYERNSSGETFGSLSLAEVDADAPDLIAAIGTNGVQGYVRSVDVIPPLPHSPEEAVKQNRTGVRMLTLYASDGKTVLGLFKAGVG